MFFRLTAEQLKQNGGSVSFMRRKNVTNAIIRESITQALLLLMKERPFSQISITEIVKKAGVGRVSFYRNYRSKEDVLVSALNEAAFTWWEEFNRAGRTDYVLGVFEHCLTVKEVILLLYEHGRSHLLWENVNDLLGPWPEDDELLSYQKACLAGSVFGILSEWIRRGMTDSQEKMTEIFDGVQVDAMIRRVQESVD